MNEQKSKLHSSEKYIEQKLKKAVEEAGGLCIKLQSGTFSSLPDRMLLLNGYTIFVEVKTTGKKPTKLQTHTHDQLRAQGFMVYVLDRLEYIPHIIDRLKEGVWTL